MKAESLVVGYLGESIAKAYLRSKGYRIIEQNYRTKYAEIDLVACDRKVLVFVEVKTKAKEEFGSPETTLNRKKINKLIRCAAAYIAAKGYDKAYRIDAVCIVLDERRKIQRLAHYKNITF